ncbi:MAG: cytochrome c [Pseudomonadota bacterium]|nr:cytochrome c [Pseudomonadota bacterium]
MDRKNLMISVIVTLVLLTIGFPNAQAADDADDVIKFRQNVMKGVGAHINNIAAVAKGKITFRGNLVSDAQGIINGLATAGDLFPKGTDGGKTNALSSVWEDPSGFEEALSESHKRAIQLLDVIQGSGGITEIGIALGALGKSCGQCHKPYRKKM